MALVAKNGACVYCGQMRSVEVDEGITDNAVDMEVTKWCSCHAASEERNKIAKMEVAQMNVDKLFESNSEEVREFLKAAVVLIGEHRAGKISVELGGKVKAQISKTSKGNIKVERTFSKKEAIES